MNMKLNIKKITVYVLVFFISLFVFSNNVVAATDWENICADANIKKTVQTVGYVIQLIKWIVPMLIIVLGMVDLGKAVISNDDKAIPKASKALIRRFIAGIVVFFIPTILLASLNMISNFSKSNTTKAGTGTFINCSKCLFDPFHSC